MGSGHDDLRRLLFCDRFHLHLFLYGVCLLRLLRLHLLLARSVLLAVFVLAEQLRCDLNLLPTVQDDYQHERLLILRHVFVEGFDEQLIREPHVSVDNRFQRDGRFLFLVLVLTPRNHTAYTHSRRHRFTEVLI